MNSRGARPTFSIWTPALSLILLGLSLIAAEGIARTDLARAHLLSPSISSDLDYVSAKYAGLEQVAATHRPIDCLVIGSSMASWGVSIKALTESFAQQAGRTITCYNFGLQAATVIETQKWARFLAGRFRPSYLIFITSYRDFFPAEYADANVSPWVEYQLGEQTPEGWLLVHSAAYRQYLTYREWTRPDFWESLAERRRLEAMFVQEYGFDIHTESSDISVPPDPEELARHQQSLRPFSSESEHFARFEALLDLQDEQTQIVVVEAPVALLYMGFPANGRQDYDRFMKHIQAVTQTHNTPFWMSTWANPDLIPPDGWSNYSHLNATGGVRFGDWLGQLLADLSHAESGRSN